MSSVRPSTDNLTIGTYPARSPRAICTVEAFLLPSAAGRAHWSTCVRACPQCQLRAHDAPKSRTDAAPHGPRCCPQGVRLQQRAPSASPAFHNSCTMGISVRSNWRSFRCCDSGPPGARAGPAPWLRIRPPLRDPTPAVDIRVTTGLLIATAGLATDCNVTSSPRQHLAQPSGLRCAEATVPRPPVECTSTGAPSRYMVAVSQASFII